MIETLKLALEALEAFLRFAAIHHDGPDTSDKYLAEDYAVEGFRKARQVLPALRTAIETAEKQEPPVQFKCTVVDDQHLAGVPLEQWGTHITKTWFDGEKLVTQEIAESEVYKQEPMSWAEEIIADLHACYNTELIKEIDSGDALIRLDAAIACVEEAEQRHTTPPAAQRQWVGLTDADKREFAAAQHGWEDLLAAAEAKLKEKNT